jgi:hypothetical protein
MSEPLEYYGGNAAEVFATDLYRVENLGTCSRLIFVIKKNYREPSGHRRCDKRHRAE